MFRQIKETLNRKWVEYLFEVAAIIVGLLLAFMLDSWHEERQNRKEEQQILEGLRDEFAANLEAVDRDIRINETTIGAVQDIIAMMRAGEMNNDPERFFQLLAHVLLFSSFDAQTGFNDEIINSGKLNLIQDQHLKVQLTKWSSILENADEDINLSYDFYNLVLSPYLIEHLPMTRVDQYLDFSKWSASYQHENTPPGNEPIPMNQLNMMQLESVLWQHKFNQDFNVLNSNDIRSFLQTTLSMIERNIGE